MVIKNSSTYGASLTSLGDGSDASFWRQGGAWDSGTPSNTAITVGTSYNAIAAITGYAGPNTAPAGFTTYLIMFNFGNTGTLPSADTQVYAGLGLDNTGTGLIMDYQVGYTTKQEAAAFSGSFIYNAPDTQPFNLYLYAKTGTGTMHIAFAHITVIGIN